MLSNVDGLRIACDGVYMTVFEKGVHNPSIMDAFRGLFHV
jgi:hypothetical protein